MIEATAFRWDGQRLLLLDQRRLPFVEQWVECTSAEEVAEAIRLMITRGAPLIGIVAAFGMVLGVKRAMEQGQSVDLALEKAAEELIAARPTAVNLSWAVRRMQRIAREIKGASPGEIYLRVEQEAVAIYMEDLRANRLIGQYGAALLPQGAKVLTHCNTGALAVSDLGTALGVIKTGYTIGKVQCVWIDETRPFLQGSRLSAWELQKAGIPFKILVDGAAAWLMQAGEVDVVVVGADRIAANGDTANKIGTYMLAICAARFGIPFYVAAPTSTIDLSIPDGTAIPIEYRPDDEVLCWHDVRVAPNGARAWNPSFDVTPAELITAIITERGIARPPYRESIAALFEFAKGR